MNKARGFTLIELIVVIAIIGILAAILVPTMLGYVNESKLTSANSTAAGLQRAAASVLISYDTRNEELPDDDYVSALASSEGTYDSYFASSIEEYYKDVNDAYWGIRVEANTARATVYAKNANDRFVGTAPKAKSEASKGNDRTLSNLLAYALS